MTAIKLLCQHHRGLNVFLSKEPEQKQTVATDVRQPLYSEPDFILKISRNTHTHAYAQKQQQKQGAYGFTDGLEDTVNEARAVLAEITGGMQAVNLTAER